MMFQPQMCIFRVRLILFNHSNLILAPGYLEGLRLHQFVYAGVSGQRTEHVLHGCARIINKSVKICHEKRVSSAFNQILCYVFAKLFNISNIILQVIVELLDIDFRVHMNKSVPKPCRGCKFYSEISR